MFMTHMPFGGSGGSGTRFFSVAVNHVAINKRSAGGGWVEEKTS